MDPDNPDFWNIRKNLHTLKTYFEKCESQRFEHQIQRISLTLLQPARPPIYCNKQKLHCNNFLQIYKTNHLNLTLDLIWFFTLKCFAEILWNFKTHYLQPILCWHMHDIWYTFWSIIDWEKGKLIPNIIY